MSGVLATLRLLAADTGLRMVGAGRAGRLGATWPPWLSVTTLPVVIVTRGAPTTRTSGAIWSVTLRPSTFLLMV